MALKIKKSNFVTNFKPKIWNLSLKKYNLLFHCKFSKMKFNIVSLAEPM